MAQARYVRYATNVEDFESRKLTCHPKDIVASLRDKEFKPFHTEPDIQLNEHATNSRILRAKQLVAQDSISFSAKLGLFTVVDQHSIHTVRLYPDEICSCSIKKNCFHILGVKIGQRMDIDNKDLEQQNLGVIRKNQRQTNRQKPGRKRPRPGDVSVAEVPNKVQNTDKILIETLSQLEKSLVDMMRSRGMSVVEEEAEEIDEHEEVREQDVTFDNIVCSTPKSELQNDIRYSLEVWITADKDRIFQNLNIHERNILLSKKEWLNDVIIDCSMNLLQYQFPELEGFQSCHLAHQLDFERHKNLFIQIINRSPNTEGSHWLTISNINCMEDEVTIYDSSYQDLPHIEEITIASLVYVQSEKKVLKVKFSNVYQQTNSNDCGLYAIANATALAYGRDPSREVFIQCKMRGHLSKCLEEKQLVPFPTANGPTKRRKNIKKVIEVPLFCVCKMPDTRTLYVFCDQCGDEYHPECLGIPVPINESTVVICQNCKT